MANCEIIIVGFRCEDDIVQCLQSVAALDGGQFSIRICENGGPTSFRALTAALGQAFGPGQPDGYRSERVDDAQRFALAGGIPVHAYRASGNLGYAGGVNAVLDCIAPDAAWDSIWILNPDTQPMPDALEALRRRAAEGGYGVVGSRMILTRSNTIQMYAGRWRRTMARGYNIGLGAAADALPNVSKIEAVMDYVCGASMYVTRDFITKVGQMDERYFLYAEEVDWCFRRGAFKLGYAHDSVVHHAHGATIGSSHDRRSRSSLSVYLDERSKILFTQRFFPKLYPLVIVSTFLLAAQYLKAGAFKNYGVALAGWWAGLRGEHGFPQAFAPKPAERIRFAGTGPTASAGEVAPEAPKSPRSNVG